jgi:riboflavin synthase
MFTGIIEKQARVISAQEAGSILRVRIAKPRTWKLAVGQSVNVDGICSTVVKHSAAAFEVDYMPTTLEKTTAALFKKGRSVNLERALKFGQRVDGHLLQGHVDCKTAVRGIRARGASCEITIKPKAQLSRRAILHGSIAVNGVSLTVAQKHGPNITFALIPHTLKSTNLGALRVGDEVNVEFDALATFASAATRSSR